MSAVVNAHVGRRLRVRRNALGMTLNELGEAVGKTYQQIQKYELGQNRVSAGTLFEISQALKVPMPYFYEGLTDYPQETQQDAVQVELEAFLQHRFGPALALAFMKLPSEVQLHFVSFMRSLAKGESHV